MFAQIMTFDKCSIFLKMTVTITLHRLVAFLHDYSRDRYLNYVRQLYIDTNPFDFYKLQTSTRTQCPVCVTLHIHICSILLIQFFIIASPDSCMFSVESKGLCWALTKCHNTWSTYSTKSIYNKWFETM